MEVNLILIYEKLKESLFAVLPIVIVVLILNFTLVTIDHIELIKFIVGAFFVFIGLALFLFGVELGIEPIGKLIGSILTKKNKFWFVIIAGLILGFIISIAEPDLHILGFQIEFVTSGTLSRLLIVIVVSIGISFLLAIGLSRILYNVSLKHVLIGCYVLILVLSFFVSKEFMAIAFDASGATTGALTVPFILALAIGVSSMKKDSKASKADSFGLVAVTSTGAIIAVLLLSIIMKNEQITAISIIEQPESTNLILAFIKILPKMMIEMLMSLLPIIIVFGLIQFSKYRVKANRQNRIINGIIYSFIGLTLFLTGVNAGFMNMGRLVGFQVGSSNQVWLIILIAFVMGLFTVLAEPAVHALTNQIEEVTSGYVHNKTVLGALSLGIGIALALSVIRIMTPSLQLWHYLLPGYMISLGLTFIVDDLFVGMAFDSGGVASGPITATFVLAFAQGVASAVDGANVF